MKFHQCFNSPGFHHHFLLGLWLFWWPVTTPLQSNRIGMCHNQVWSASVELGIGMLTELLSLHSTIATSYLWQQLNSQCLTSVYNICRSFCTLQKLSTDHEFSAESNALLSIHASNHQSRGLSPCILLTHFTRWVTAPLSKLRKTAQIASVGWTISGFHT
jgi:hypothetical protein